MPLKQLDIYQFSRLVVSDSLRPQTAARQASLSITNSRSPPKPMSIELVMPSNHMRGKKNLDPYLMITQKLRCTRDVNIKPKTIKLLEENI